MSEQYKVEKKNKLERKTKLRALKIMQANINRKLLMNKVNDISEDDYINLLSELNAIEINMIKLKRNKLNSNFYEFIPAKLSV